ncbi:hypothetical protein WICMUC_005592 [Wickerhamomyces mucosus]|uniref:Chitobiosyldiphosphodolichol beta-mannosyltransferase n=1 Tax=Wickerhamomyces mucosus TaxID=1378264 RepID=A0A9P8P6A9_9ASCO|nr:hypothetical protein WICMUC_005592 [Wickerhamomyces mucosus]
MHWIWWLIAAYLALPLTYFVIPFIYKNASIKKRIIIIVLGDLNHSPRMNYHAKSFIKKGYSVDLCGYLEDDSKSDLAGHDDNLIIHQLSIINNSFNLPFIIFAILKVLSQVFGLFKLLWDLRGAHYILLQNPPSVPILAISIFYKYIFGSKLIIDWHNLNYTILSIKLGPNHPLVKICKFYEQYLSKFADLNLTVTKAMKKYLVKDFQLLDEKIIVLYDKANNSFNPETPDTFHKLVTKYPDTFKNIQKNEIIVVTSTSFTPDEDFNILLDALQKYDIKPKLPALRVIVTGKGPLKSEFLHKVKQSEFKNISIHSVWLSFEDYPKILSIAHLGVSLHTSSSGLDLPMKIVDMFGCGIPVISLNFPSIGELVDDGINGLIVNSSYELFETLSEIVIDDKKLSILKSNALIKSRERWDENWNSNLGKILPD